MRQRYLLRSLGFILITAASTVAGAWETDPFTGRGAPLADASATADLKVDRIVDAAIAEVNARLGCDAAPAAQEAAVGRAIYEGTAPRTPVPDRGGVRGQGFGVYAAWLESGAEVERRWSEARQDVFAGIPFMAAPILSAAGVCATVSLGGHEIGTDKPDHFFYNGYWYWQLVAESGSEADAVAWGTRTENTYYGLDTSSTFSYADLYANWQGYQFYRSLFDGYLARDPEGCVVRAAAFHWADWVDERWDELLNPNVYRPRVTAWLGRVLDLRGNLACQDLAPHRDAILTQTPRLLREPAPWVGPTAPPRADPYRIAARCALSWGAEG
jgi:hypothetical protein